MREFLKKFVTSRFSEEPRIILSNRHRSEEKPFLYPALEILPDSADADGLTGDQFLFCVRNVVRILRLKFPEESLNLFWDRYHDSSVHDGGMTVTSWEKLNSSFENLDGLLQYHRRDERSFWNVFNKNYDFLLRFHVEVSEDFCHVELVADESILDAIESCLQDAKFKFWRTTSKELCCYYSQS